MRNKKHTKIIMLIAILIVAISISVIEYDDRKECVCYKAKYQSEYKHPIEDLKEYIDIEVNGAFKLTMIKCRHSIPIWIKAFPDEGNYQAALYIKTKRD